MNPCHHQINLLVDIMIDYKPEVFNNVFVRLFAILLAHPVTYP